MEWRCEWCGKPHPENDPPCDNCGHGSFEEAVVRQTDRAEGDPDETTVWVCTACGRTHTKHSPPCSRCGNHELVREHQRVGDDELVAPGYFDLLTPRYVLGLVSVLALAALFVLGLTGTVAVPGFGTGVPELSEVPGEGESGGLSLSTVEDAYVEERNRDRAGAGLANLSRDDDLDAVAQYLNHRAVVTARSDREPSGQEAAAEVLAERCGGLSNVEQVSGRVALSALGERSEAPLATALRDAAPGRATPFERGRTGVDVHVVDGDAVLVGLAC